MAVIPMQIAGTGGAWLIAAATPLATGDEGEAKMPTGSTALAGSLQVTGAFGGATVALCESNDGVTWFTAKQPNGTSDASLTEPGLIQFSSAARILKVSGPNGAVIGGAGAAVTPIICLRG